MKLGKSNVLLIGGIGLLSAGVVSLVLFNLDLLGRVAVYVANVMGHTWPILLIAIGSLVLAAPRVAIIFRRRSENFRPMSKLALASGILLSLLLALISWVLFSSFLPNDGGVESAKLKVEALKTALTVGAGAGGLFALYVATRRQWLSELVHEHEKDVSEASERDAEERRITELYSKGVEQLGSDKAMVRLGGLYALERLAHDNPDHRQSIVNIICAYLRMPFEWHTGEAPSDEKETGSDDKNRDRDVEQEFEVRIAAQRIICSHLEAELPADRTRLDDAGDYLIEVNPKFWPNVEIDLHGARLINFELWSADVKKADFSNASFEGVAEFSETHFREFIHFSGSTFNCKPQFTATQFEDDAWFDDCVFVDDVDFYTTSFRQAGLFMNAEFRSDVRFERRAPVDLTDTRVYSDENVCVLPQGWSKVPVEGKTAYRRITVTERNLIHPRVRSLVEQWPSRDQ